MEDIMETGDETVPTFEKASLVNDNGRFDIFDNLKLVERGRRIELLALAWKAKVLPLYEPRMKSIISTNKKNCKPFLDLDLFT
jgi:hypothetical protein